MIKKTGIVLKSIKPGRPGSRRWLRRYGSRLLAVRYRGDGRRRIRMTTVEIVVEERFWDPAGHQNYHRAMSKSGQSV
jgi:hypothetical protein